MHRAQEPSHLHVCSKSSADVDPPRIFQAQTQKVMSCNVLQRVAVCHCVLQRVAVCCGVLRCVAVCRRELQCVVVPADDVDPL